MARCHICSILIAMFHDVSHSNAGETSGSNACLQSRSQRIAGARGCRLGVRCISHRELRALKEAWTTSLAHSCWASSIFAARSRLGPGTCGAATAALALVTSPVCGW